MPRLGTYIEGHKRQYLEVRMRIRGAIRYQLRGIFVVVSLLLEVGKATVPGYNGWLSQVYYFYYL